MYILEVAQMFYLVYSIGIRGGAFVAVLATRSNM